MGIFFSAGWSPCVGLVLTGVLALAMTAGQIQRGLVLLAAYSAGLAIPFLLAALGLRDPGVGLMCASILLIACSFSTLCAATLSSGILDTGSNFGLVRILAALSAKWKVMNTTPGGEASVILALEMTSPRRELILTLSP